MLNKVQHPGAVARAVMNRFVKKTKGTLSYKLRGYRGLPNTICCVLGYAHILFIMQWGKTLWPIEFRECFDEPYYLAWSEPYVCNTPARLRLLIMIKLEEEEKYIKKCIRDYYYSLNYMREASENAK